MRRFCFRTHMPFDHVQRAIDILRKMGFKLDRIIVQAHGDAFSVILDYEQHGTLSVAVFENRLMQLSGLQPFIPGERASCDDGSQSGEAGVVTPAAYH